MNVEVRSFELSRVQTCLLVMASVLCLSLLAQLKIRLPFTPVPITGQTFGVTFLALCFGRRVAVPSVFLYLTCGAIGLPVFAGGVNGLNLGPTLGYLVGMLASSYVIGWLRDLGLASNFKSALLCGFCGSLVLFSCGATVLAFFVPFKFLLLEGVLPFLPGDVAKTTLAAAAAIGGRHVLSSGEEGVDP